MPSNARNLANLLGAGETTISAEKLGSDVAPGTEDYSSIDSLGAGTIVGETAFVEGSNRLYIWNGSGWYNIALINTTPTWDSGGQPASSYILDADSPQTVTTITLAASDPEGFPISYDYITSGQMDSIATVSQDSSVFTVTPKTLTQAPDGGTGSITFRATDGINILPQVSSFTLTFSSIVENNRYTTLLATATDTSDNNNITDASLNNHTITVNGDAYAGTFSPYRSGGYSTYFTGSAGDRLEVGNQSGNWSDTGTVTIEFWFYSTRTPSTDEGDGLGAFFTPNVQAVTATRFDIENSSNDLEFRSFSDAAGNGLETVTIKSALTPHNWYHLAAVKNGQVWKFYVNGVLEHTHTQSTTYNWSGYGSGNYNKHFIGQTRDAVSFQGYITDIRVSSNQAYTTAFTAPAERLEADSNTTFFYSGTGYIGDTHSSTASNNESITVNGNVSTKPFSPYDNLEYSATDHGGSVYFVGGADYSSQYLSLSGPSMPSGDFTLSTWAYLTHTVNDNKTLIDFNGNSGGFRILYMNGTNGYHFRFYTAGGTVYLYDQSITHSLNQWYYIVVVRDSGTFKLYVNNRLINTSTATPTFSSSNNVRIGQAIAGTGTLEGYLSDIIYNPTTAITDFTPPTAPLSSTGAALHIKGTDASIIDKSQGANLKLVGNTTGSTTQVKFASTKSMYFDGSGDSIDFNTAVIPTVYNEDHTFEFWAYLTSLSRRQSPIAQYAVSQAGRMILYFNTNGSVEYYQNGLTNSGYITSSSALISINNWYHIAVSNSNGTRSLFVDGNLIGTMSGTQDMYSGITTIGRCPSQSYDYTGYIQDLRITKGLARYTANFTPPTASLEG